MDALDLVDRVAELESEAKHARVRAARALRRCREDAELSLRDVASKVRLTPMALRSLERGEAWRTTTARRVARYYGPRGTQDADAE